MPDNLRTLLVDGISISITDQGAQAVEKLQRMLTDAETRISAKDGEMAALTSSRISAIQAKDAEMIVAANAHANAIQAKDAEMAVAANAHAGVIAAKDAEIARLAALTDAASIDAQIEARAAVIATTRRTLGDSFDPKGKSITDMQAAVVTKRLGDAAVAGRPPEFFAAAFDTLALADAANPSVDPLRVIVASGVTEPVVLADKRMSYEERKANAWKGSK